MAEESRQRQVFIKFIIQEIYSKNAYTSVLFINKNQRSETKRISHPDEHRAHSNVHFIKKQKVLSLKFRYLTMTIKIFRRGTARIGLIAALVIVLVCLYYISIGQSSSSNHVSKELQSKR